jgi:fatty acid elongase 3
MDQLQEFSVWFLDVDWTKVEWKQLVSMQDFHWKYGATPFSQLQVIVTISILYMISIFSLQNYMKDKKPLKLWLPSLLHNIFLTALSLVMFLGASYGAYLKFQSQGFWAGWVCEQDPEPIKGPLFFWSYIFYLSKFYELIDSYLIVLKKKPLIFLHVWHHFIMPYVCWAGLEGKWCMALWTSAFWNSFVHVLMYFYYTIATFGYSPWWKKHLTALQIYQFVSGVCYTSVYFYYYLKDIRWIGFHIGNSEKRFPESLFPFSFQQGCTGDLWAVCFMFFVNNSFLVLFSKWYLENYSSSNKSSKRNGNAEFTFNEVNKELNEPKDISESSNSNINSPSNPKKND